MVAEAVVAVVAVEEVAVVEAVVVRRLSTSPSCQSSWLRCSHRPRPYDDGTDRRPAWMRWQRRWPDGGFR